MGYAMLTMYAAASLEHSCHTSPDNMDSSDKLCNADDVCCCIVGTQLSYLA